MKKLFLLLLFALSANLAISQTQTYLISSAQLVNMGSNCGSTGAFYVNGGGITGFDYTDNIPAGSTVTSVTVEIAVGIECTAETKSTTMNGVSQTSFTTVNECICDPTGTNGIKTITVSPSNYVVGGTNQFRINSTNHFGLKPSATLSNNYARVTVNYTTGYFIPAGQLVNMGSNCGTTGAFYVSGAGITGFDWTDATPGAATITSVVLELSVGIECSAGTRTTTLNGAAQPSFTTVAECICDPTGTNGIKTLNLTPANYIKGGTNQFRINAASSFGLRPSTTLGGYYARITVNYTIGGPVFTITSPNGGENWATGTTQNITWSTTGTSTTVNLQYSTDGGSTWNAIVNGISNTGTYAWTIPTIATNSSCRIRVQDSASPSTYFDISNANFTITQSTLTLTSPNGGEVWGKGSTQNVTWTSTGGMANVNLYYSSNSGSSWTLFQASTPNDGSYAWSIPTGLTDLTTYRVKVEDAANSATFDASNANFTINSSTQYVIPAGQLVNMGSNCGTTGAFYVSGAGITGFDWTDATPGGATVTSVVIELSVGIECSAGTRTTTLNGAAEPSFTTVAECICDPTGTNGIKTLNLTPANLIKGGTNQFRINAASSFGLRPSSTLGGYYARISVTYTMGTGPVFNVTAPNGGENWTTGSTQNITWTTTGTSTNVNLQYSTDAGSTWNTIVNGISNTGSYAWTIPSIATSTTCRVRVQDSTSPSTYFDVSNANFTITLQSTLTLSSPNGGETWGKASVQYITWSSTGGIANVNLFYSSDAGSTWNSIQANTTNDGSYLWTIPTGLASLSTYRVKVENSANTAVFDASNANFTINTPNNYVIPASQLVNMGSNCGVVGAYYVSGSGITGFDWTDVTPGGATVTSVVMEIAVGIECSAGTRTTTLNGAAEPSFTTVAECICDPTGLNGIKTLNLSPSNYIKGGNNQFRINASSSFGLMPSAALGGYYARVTVTYTTGTGPVFTVTSPNGGENWTTGSTHNITWTTTGTSTNVNLQYSTDGGSTWNAIVNGISNTGTYAWTIPSIATSTTCRVRVQDSASPSVYFDMSNSNFTITQPPTITVTYPNGGENLTSCNTTNISWNASGTSYYYTIQYSTNNGSTWNTITTNYYSGSSTPSYSWTVPSLSSSTCLVKVTDTYNSSITDQSNSVFTISNTSNTVTVTQPNGGEVINAGSTYVIKWTATGTFTYVRFQYSTDNGGTWNYCYNSGGQDWDYTTNGSTGYSWVVPSSISSNNCLIRIADYYNSCVTDISNAVFTIVQSPTITVNTPNGGNSWVVGSNYGITWSSVAVNNVSIQYSTNNGSSWITITASTPASSGYYNWTVPNTPSSSCLVKITDVTNSSVTDQSNSIFSIVSPVITVTTPNGGEVWTGLTSQYIYWTSSNTSNYVNITISTDNGATWNSVVNAAYNYGYYYYSIPNYNSNTCLVKVTDYYNSSVTDQSNSVFTIVQATPTITVNYPNGGETFAVGTSQYITWTSVSVPNVKIEYSTDNGGNWSTITASTSASSGYYLWSVPSTTSTNCLVRVSDATDSNPIDQSNSVFTIAQPTITVTSPNGGENYTGLTSQNVTWTSTAVSNYVSIAYSTDNGGSWLNVVSYTYNDGNYSWTVPNTPSTNCKVRISDYYTSTILDESNAVFTINAAPASITVTYPNGGEVFTSNTSYYVYWTAVSVNNVKIEYSTDNGSNWNSIVASTSASAGYYIWNTPNVTSTSCLVRVSDATSGTPLDQSNSTFTIGQPIITVTSPNGGESWTGLSNYTITWSSQYASNYVNLYYSTNNGSTWATIYYGLYNSGSYNWTTPNVSTTSALIRVADYYTTSVKDESNAVFTINQAAASITLNSPNGGEVWGAGSSYYIYWTSVSIANVHLEYSTDNGSSWNTIIASTNASTGYYNWTIPTGISSNVCRVRVSDASNASTNDQSNTTFSIQQPVITVTTPNGGQTWTGLTYQYIYWTSTGASNYVKLEYSTNSGTTWNTIASSAYNNGSYYWAVPNVSSLQCLVRVTDYYTASIKDESDAVFSINTAAPDVTLITPNGGQNWVTGGNYAIIWSSVSIQNVTLQYSTNNGINWTTIVSSTSASAGTYNWTVPNTVSCTALIKIFDASNSAVYDQSSANFCISAPSITVNSPNGGETWYVGENRYLSWSSLGVNTVTIYYSTDNGVNWSTIVSGTPNYGYYYWSVPNTPSTNCRVRVSSGVNASLFDDNNFVFEIKTPTPTLTVTSPNGGEAYVVGSTHYITWSSVAVSTVKVELTTDEGSTWTTLANNFNNTGYYYWVTPNAVSDSCWVKVSSATNSAVTDMSNNRFSIVPNTPAISVISPNGGENWCLTAFKYITWSSTAVTSVNIDLSTNNGSTWINIASSIPASTGSYYYNVPNNGALITSNALIKITDASNGSLFDISNTVYSISNCSTAGYSIMTDSVDVNVCKGDSIAVTFSKSGVFSPGNTFTVQLSDTAGNFGNPTPIGYLYGDTPGTIMCYIPVTVKSGTGYRVRVISDDPALAGTDNGDNISILGTDFDFSADEILKYLPDGIVNFTYAGDTNNVTSYAWSFGSGDSSSTRNPSYFYSQVGYFDVSLTVTNTNGCAVTMNKPFYIRVERVLENTPLVTNTSANINAVAFVNSNVGCVALTNGNCLITTDQGQTWTESVTGSTNPLTGASLQSGNWYVSGQSGYLAVSTDQGSTWSSYNSGTSNDFTGISFVSGTVGYAVGENGTLMSYNSGTWVAGTSGTTENYNSVSAKGSYAYAVGDNGTISKYDGANWQTQTSGTTARLTGVQFVDASFGYAVGENGLVLRTSDQGANWEPVLSGLDIDFSSVMTSGADTAYAAGEEGIVYFTKDKGNSWERYSVGDTIQLNGVEMKGGKGYIAGNAGALRQIGSTQGTTNVNNPFAPVTKLEFAIYPNPTISEVTIQGQTEENVQLVINLKDMQGRTLVEVMNAKNTGNYSTTVDLKDMPAGVYFVHIADGSRSIVKRVVKQ